jgi:hypothetical protein
MYICDMTDRAKIRAALLVGVAFVGLAAVGVATAWLAPAGVGILIGLGAARVFGGRRRNV